VLVEGKASYCFTLADGRQVKGHDLIEGKGWRWQQHPWEAGVRYVRLRATSPTYGQVTVVIVDAPGQDRCYLLCLTTERSAPQLIRRWRRRSWIECVFRTLKHLLATEACQVHSEDAYYGHLVVRLMGCFVLFYTSRVICKGHLTMEIDQSCNLRRINILSLGCLCPHQRGGRPQRPQSGQFGRVCMHEPQRRACPRGSARLEMPFIDPGIQGLMGDLELVGQLQDRPFMGTAGHRARSRPRSPQTLPDQYTAYRCPGKACAPLRGTPAFSIQRLRNRRRRAPLRMERADTVHQGGIITQLLQPRDRSVEGGGRGMPTRPVEGQGHMFCRAV
jgi:hypothetical protein